MKTVIQSSSNESTPRGLSAFMPHATAAGKAIIAEMNEQPVNVGNLKSSFVITHRDSIEHTEPAICALRGDVAHDEPLGKVVLALT